MVTSTSPSPGQKKSGMKTLKPGEVLFNEGDSAESMYIIQKGQIRLFRPKGKGFVEIAVLRSGEMIGEMAYFDPSSKRRSASASAITQTDIIEISFTALEKTMVSLNPWFKTLINTIAERLRKTNERVRELESNSVGYSSDYKFFQSAEVVKILSLLFFTFRTLGEQKEDRWFLNTSKLKMYTTDIFTIQESKVEEFMQLLLDEKLIEASTDSEDSTKVYSVAQPEFFRTFQIFFNTQRSMKDEKKLNISAKCEKFIVKVIEQTKGKIIEDGVVEVNLTEIVNYFKDHNMGISLDDFQAAKNARFCGEYKMDAKGVVTSMVNIDYLNRMYPVVKFMNALNRINESKARA
jgi:CRP/FNR family cyclic AMP-dependent transcriptional regulator